MGVDAINNGVKICKGVVSSIKTCYRWLCNHSLLLAALFIFYIIYRFFPSLFTYLISSSPILICTAVLLRTLVSFGHPDIPQIKEKRTREITSLKLGTVGDDPIAEKDEKFCAEARGGKIREIQKKTVEEVSASKEGKLRGNKEKKVSFSPIRNDGLIGRSVVIEDKPKELYGILRSGRGIKDRSPDVGKEEIECIKAEIEKPMGQVHGTHLNGLLGSSKDSSWNQIEDNANSSNFGSDLVENSSPEASMAEMVPVLDELHPLLDFKPPHPALKSSDEFDAVMECSDISNDGSVESEDAENQEEDEEEAQGDERDNRTKAVVTWTEDDEKNLMDLGTSELERNQRLENLIARRRARKFLSKEAEKNLIDLDVNDPPSQIPTISTVRSNPFDLPFFSNEIEGLPPIPGSAPSILVPGGNPFDLPYDPLEEKPNLTEDSFHEEFMSVLQKDMFFCRHESFSLGNSLSGGLKQERREARFGLFFATGGKSTEGTEYPTLQGKLGVRSDSKSGYVPKSELPSSVANQEDRKKLIEQELTQESGPISDIVDYCPDFVKQERQNSKVDVVAIDQEQKRDINIGKDEMKGKEKEIILTDTNKTVGEKYNGSSSSSLSELNKKISDMKTNEVKMKILDPAMGNGTEGSSNPIQPLQSLKDSDVMSMVADRVDDDQPKEPIYDSSPSAIEKRTIEESLFCVDKGVVLTSASSLASDLQVEVSEVGSPPVPVERTISLTDGESFLYSGRDKDEISSDVAAETESSLTQVTEINELDVVKVNQDNNSISALTGLESVVEQVSINSNSISSPVKESLEGSINHVPSSGDPETLDGVHQLLSEAVGPMNSSPSEKTQPEMEELKVQPSSDGNHHEENEVPSVNAVKEASANTVKEANIINNVNEHEVNKNEGKDNLKSIDDTEGDHYKLIEHKDLANSPQQMETGISTSDDIKANGVEVQGLEASHPEDKKLHEEENEKSMDLESAHDKSMLKGNDEIEVSNQGQNHIQTS